MIEPARFSFLIAEAVFELTGAYPLFKNVDIFNLTKENCFDLLELPEGYEKPSKDTFGRKLQEALDNEPKEFPRDVRDELLAKTDYLVMSDYPHETPEIRQAWIDYRQALRDLPANTEDPENPVWPTPPN